MSLFTLDTCPLLDTHKVQMPKHVLIRNFTRAIAHDAAAGSGAVFRTRCCRFTFSRLGIARCWSTRFESIGCFA